MTYLTAKLEQTWRWFGTYDTIHLNDIRQTGATGIVTALHHLPIGSIWPVDEIMKRKNEIEQSGLTWLVVESIPVHEDIKRHIGKFQSYIENYKQSIRNLGQCGIHTVCYNFMPVLDWTRTDLDYVTPDGSTALRFEETALAAFDVFILKRKGAENDYTGEIINKAKTFIDNLESSKKEILIKTILAGLPGSEEGYTFSEFEEMLKSYEGLSSHDLKKNLSYFIREITPVAVEAGVRLAIHPDDPPFPLFGLPRVVSTEEDAKAVIEACDAPNNGLTLCTGSYGARPDNDLPGMAKRLGNRINFIHLRNVLIENGRTFHESDHLDGSVDMAGVIKALILEQQQRISAGRSDINIPMRPDHGHKMLYDLKKDTFPGYSLIGRMRGLAELRGLEMGIRKSLTQ
jgi:mannonate dehydratase